MPAADELLSAASTVRSSAPVLALMPQCRAADRKPSGAVTPPVVGAIAKSRTVEDISGMERSQRNARLLRTVQGKHHGVLAAGTEVCARAAVGFNLLRQPRVGHDRKSHPDEVAGQMCKRAQRL